MFILVLALYLFSFVFLDLDESSNLDTDKTNLENSKLVGKNVAETRITGNTVLKALFLSYHDLLQTCRHGILQCIQKKKKIALITRKYMLFFFTPPRNRGGVIFLLQFVCVCLSVCL